ncbi:orotate phosphoribosyltransferase [Saitoella complicata NRRL Y-17804]|nr:orotate phosphoribosyltransferase [Saitoella complicata NRRL Y-17804]ODQ55437.1 orotate phosphoribosyltransferase [Saitoella complicata NRRL Y-17804]
MPLQDYQRSLLDLAVNNSILKFSGPYTLKSGRQSPYFFNCGLFNTASLLSALGSAYARAIVDSGIQFDVLFGPAYKGIPLAAITAAKLADVGGGKYADIGYAFNRKEAKTHGEGGNLVGASMEGKRVLVIDDVITAGTAIREAVEIIKAAGGTFSGVCVVLDRQEKGASGDLSAIGEVRKEFGVKVSAIITLDDIVEFTQDALEPAQAKEMQEYRKAWKAEGFASAHDP